jgi:predicted nucleic acid-binding protein
VPRFVADVAAVTGLTADAPPPHLEVCHDPGDDYLIALARAERVDAIVTAGLDLLALTESDVSVIRPRQLIERLERGD